jgi:hypothetical protein
MDLHGKKPLSKSGNGHNPNMGQLPIFWQHCKVIAPDIMPQDQLGDRYTEWKVNDADSLKLAHRLRKWLDSGNCEISQETSKQAPAEVVCIVCPDCFEIEQKLRTDRVRFSDASRIFDFNFHGVDVISGPDIIVPSFHNSQTGCECETCLDTGFIIYRVKARLCDIKAVEAFIEFLLNCGGFGSGIDF